MAVTTTALLQTALDENLNDQGASAENLGSNQPIKILKEEHDSSLYSRWYCVGHPTDVDDTDASSRVITFAPRAMWCRTTISGNAAAQAAEIIAAMTSSDPSGTVTTDANVDPDIGPSA